MKYQSVELAVSLRGEVLFLIVTHPVVRPPPTHPLPALCV